MNKHPHEFKAGQFVGRIRFEDNMKFHDLILTSRRTGTVLICYSLAEINQIERLAGKAREYLQKSKRLKGRT